MMRRLIIAGASGLVGTAAANSFLAAGWEVIATSRRRPELLDLQRCRWLQLDLQDARACRSAILESPDITHLVYAAVYELPGLMPGWSDPRQIETNGQMFRNLLGPLSATGRLEHVTLLQGTKAYGGAVKPMRVPAREDQLRVEHPNFYWLQEDHLRKSASTGNFSFTILRPQLIVGPNHGVVMNIVPIIGAYAAIRQAEGLPFSFPSDVEWVWEAADARLVGNACLWAATTSIAGGETYNLTNGEVFSFRDMWPELARTLGVSTGPAESFSVAEYLLARSDIWTQIVAEHSLQPLTLAELVGESHHYADLCFAVGATQSPTPVFVSTVKIRQAGFTDSYNTEQSFCYWLENLMARRVLPQF